MAGNRFAECFRKMRHHVDMMTPLSIRKWWRVNTRIKHRTPLFQKKVVSIKSPLLRLNFNFRTTLFSGSKNLPYLFQFSHGTLNAKEANSKQPMPSSTPTVCHILFDFGTFDGIPIGKHCWVRFRAIAGCCYPCFPWTIKLPRSPWAREKLMVWIQISPWLHLPTLHI
jgi:hypothetical protein